MRKNGRRRTRPAAALLLLAFGVWLPAEAGAQWTSGGGNITTPDRVVVGTGTTAPVHQLEVRGAQPSAAVNVGGAASFGNFLFAENGAARAAYQYMGTAYANEARRGALEIVNYHAYPVTLWTNGLERLRVTPAGRVGVGTSAPDSLFHVVNPLGLGDLRLQGAAGAAMTFIDTSAQGSQWRYQWRSEQGLFRMSLVNNTEGAYAHENILVANSAGNVGFGTAAPAVRLSVGGAGVNVLQTDVWVERNLHVQGPETLAQGGRGRLRVGSAWGYSGLYADASSSGGNNDLVLGAISGTVRVGPGGGVAQSLVVPNGGISASGAITGATVSATYQDVAEWVPSTQRLSAGTVVVLDGARTNHVLASSSAYDTKVAGVVSAQPGLILGVAGEGKVMVATTGRVRVKADATRAPIKVGDLLVTGETQGVAMKSVPVELGGTQFHRPGTIIGKALEPLEGGVGEILVLLSLQ